MNVHDPVPLLLMWGRGIALPREPHFRTRLSFSVPERWFQHFLIDTPGARPYRLVCHAYFTKAGGGRVFLLGKGLPGNKSSDQGLSR